MAEMTADQTKLLELIARLPVADGKIPINDTQQEDGSVILGAHGEANKTEAAIAGITKAHVISSKMQEIVKLGDTGGYYNTDRALREVARIVTSLDASQTKDTAPVAEKIGALALSETEKEFVSRAVEYANSGSSAQPDQVKEIVALAKLAVQPKPVEETAPFVTEEITKAAQAKHYEITPDGNVFNQSSVRLGSVPGRDSLQDLQAAADSVSNDEAQRIKALSTFTANLKGSPVLSGADVQLFDIGHGDGKVAAKAVETIRSAVPEAQIGYTGIDLMESAQTKARPALEAAGLTGDKAQFISGTFGMPEAEAKLAPLAGKNNLVVASHLYNTKKLDAFTKQADGLLKDNGVTYILHESGQDSWLADFRMRHAAQLRGGASDKAAEIEKHLGANNRDFAKFRVATTDKIEPLTGKEMDVFKSMETGVFTKDYSAQFQEGAEREAFQQKQKLLEYFLRAPLEAFTKEDRTVLLDDFQQMLQQSGGKLLRYSEAQAVLAPTHSKEASQAVHNAAQKTGEYFAAQLNEQQPQQTQQQQAAPSESWVARQREQQAAMQNAVRGGV